MAKARSPKRSDGSLRGPTGKGTGLAAQHEAGATRPQAALTGPSTAALTAYLGGTSLGEAKEGTRMMPRAQPSGSRLRLKREHGAYRKPSNTLLYSVSCVDVICGSSGARPAVFGLMRPQ